MSPPRPVRLLAVAVLVLACSSFRGGCVQFDGQTVRVRVDAERDRLDLLLIYRDLHSTEADASDAVDQLEQLRDGARWFAFVENWPFMLHLDDLLRDDADVPDTEATRALLRALDERLSVQPGPLWLDAQGRLCGAQRVRLEQLDDTLRLINAWIRQQLADAEEPKGLLGELEIEDAESRQLLRDAVAAGHDFVRRRGAAFAWDLPLSDAAFQKLQRDLVAHLVELSGRHLRASDDRAALTALDSSIAFLTENRWALERGERMLTLVLGDPDAASWSFVTPQHGMQHPDSLLPALRERGWTIHGPEREEQAVDEWRAFAEGD